MHSPRLSPSSNMRQPRDKRPKPDLSSTDTDSDSSNTDSDVSFDDYLNQHMSHPWGVVDYHLYLAHVEAGRNKRVRANECYLLEKDGFRNVVMDEDIKSKTAGPNPTIVFLSLPIPGYGQDCNAKLVLAVDFKTNILQGWVFETDEPLEDYRDLWLAWKQRIGELVIEVPAEEFLMNVTDAMTNKIEILEIGIMHHYGMSTQRFSGGFDTIVVLQFLQFIDDFANMFWEDADEIRAEYGAYQDDLRDNLARGSREAWFAARDGLSMQEFRQKKLKQLTSMNFFWTQTVQDLRDEMQHNVSVRQPSRVQVIEVSTRPSRVPKWLNSWPVQLVILVIMILGVCFKFGPEWTIFGALSQEPQIDLLGWWPFEWEPQPTGFFEQWPFKQISQKIAVLEALWPFTQMAQGMVLFKWWPFQRETQQMKLFGRFPLKGIQHVKVLRWWPFEQEIQNSLLFKYLPFNQQVQSMGMLGWWPSKPETSIPERELFGLSLKTLKSYKRRVTSG